MSMPDTVKAPVSHEAARYEEYITLKAKVTELRKELIKGTFGAAIRAEKTGRVHTTPKKGSGVKKPKTNKKKQ